MVILEPLMMWVMMKLIDLWCWLILGLYKVSTSTTMQSTILRTSTWAAKTNHTKTATSCKLYKHKWTNDLNSPKIVPFWSYQMMPTILKQLMYTTNLELLFTTTRNYNHNLYSWSPTVLLVVLISRFLSRVLMFLCGRFGRYCWLFYFVLYS